LSFSGLFLRSARKSVPDDDAVEDPSSNSLIFINGAGNGLVLLLLLYRAIARRAAAGRTWLILFLVFIIPSPPPVLDPTPIWCIGGTPSPLHVVWIVLRGPPMPEDDDPFKSISG
jgi:hypothetical protein